MLVFGGVVFFCFGYYHVFQKNTHIKSAAFPAHWQSACHGKAEYHQSLSRDKQLIVEFVSTRSWPSKDSTRPFVENQWILGSLDSETYFRIKKTIFWKNQLYTSMAVDHSEILFP